MKCKKGFKIKDGKCVKKKSFFKKFNSKKYNPFKMWGSYLGLIIGLIISFLITPKCGFEQYGCFLRIIYIPLGFILGFLIGWGIHSLFRRFWK